VVTSSATVTAGPLIPPPTLPRAVGIRLLNLFVSDLV
jgi:hypothetical protein